MPRKPVIFLFLLFLLLSIGGAIGYHHLRKDGHPTFTEVDKFLREMPVPEGWRYDRRLSGSSFVFFKENLWHRLGISRKIHYGQENFYYIHPTKGQVNLCIWHTAGRVHRISFAEPPSDFRSYRFYQDALTAKYPAISDNGHEFNGTLEFP